MKKISRDIVVAGGGVAGCAAAIAAARKGHKVVLLEKLNICGGLATAGNVIYYFPICDGYGKKVITGLSEEFLLSSIKYGPGEIKEDWKDSKSRYMTTFNPASFILALDELLKEAGVEVWFDTVVTNTIIDGNKLASIECYNKSGMHKIEANCFIDTTGDADLAVMSGAEYTSGMNRMSCWTLEVNPNKNNTLGLEHKDNPDTWKSNLDSEKEGISGKLMSEYTLRSREILLQSYKNKWSKSKEKNHKNCYPAVLPTMSNFRMTRAIKGKSYIDENNSWCNFEDSVGIFPATEIMRDKSIMWSIPFGALVQQKTDNLLVAGRCMDSRDWAWENARLIPMAAQTGNIAGVAASQSIESNTSIHDLSIEKIQEDLSSQGHILNFEDAYGADWKAIAKQRLSESKINNFKNIKSNH